MADSHDDKIERAGDSIARIYALLVRVCARLPLPIALPDSEIVEGAEVIPAVRRVIDIIEDQPVDELLTAGIWGGCLHWLSAAHLYSALIDNDDHVLALEIDINLLTAGDALTNVARLMLDEE